ncbi:MAG: hypothetical protein IIA68_01925 [Proteobacteria bacterium]|nr:hypothetical protein [Pseudomonadota bacterium]
MCERCQVLRIDERILRQVLLILLSNAVRFTPRGGVVSLATLREADGATGMSVTATFPPERVLTP